MNEHTIAPVPCPPPKVFVSHSSVDKPAVQDLVDALRARGIDAWYDAYEIGPGDDIVVRLNEGLANRDVGLVVFSANTDHARWMISEVSTLFHERVEEGKLLIPVVLGDGAQIPPLVKPLARVKIEDVDRIVDAIHHRRTKPPLGTAARPIASHDVVIRVARRASELDVRVILDGALVGSCTHGELPRRLVDLHDQLLSGFGHLALRSPLASDRSTRETTVTQLGREMAAFCLPDPAAAAIAALLDRDGRIPGASIEIAIDTADPDLGSLPYESLRLPHNDQLLVDHAAVTMVRRPADLVWPLPAALPGPLKILVAVGAPDEGKTASNVLDYERELKNILDAVVPEHQLENVEVRILEASDPAAIGDALQRDQYHVLHITGHGTPGALELDDEDGNAVRVTAHDLLDALRRAQRPAPLVFLNTCHGAAHHGQTASLAESLLRGGVPAVLAMQTSVSDQYGSDLAHAFFANLASDKREAVLASRALAHARRTLERQRQEAVARDGDRRGDHVLAMPEYATAALFVAGVEAPLVNLGLDKQPLQVRPVHHLPGQVPQLDQDELIGRRGELRRALWVLRPRRNVEDATRTIDALRKGTALALVGIGGVGKSTLAGRAMRRLAEDGFLVASHVGPWDLGAIAQAVGDALLTTADPSWQLRGTALVDPGLDDARRLRLLEDTLSEAPVLLVLDDFEQNLSRDGSEFLAPDLPRYLSGILKTARRGRVLITSRFPVPGLAGRIPPLRIGPLSAAEVRKLILRLPGLHAKAASALQPVLRTIGNHPRMLELLDALVQDGVGRLDHVTDKLNELARAAAIDPTSAAGDLDEAVRQTLTLGARDVFLHELLAIARQRDIAGILLQTATSNLPVSAAGVAHMLSGAPAPTAVALVTDALRQLENLSLVVRMPDGGAWVHRWTAEGLAELVPPDEQRARWASAGRYRRWRAEHESHSVHDLIEASRNFLRAQAWDEAVSACDVATVVLDRCQQTTSVVSIIAEVLGILPEEHRATARLYGDAGDALFALGQGDDAHKAYATSLALVERRAAQEPERTEHLHDLSVVHNHMGDLFLARGHGDDARKAYAAALAIVERLAAREPERAQYLHDLGASHDRMGDLFLALGNVDEGHKAFTAALAILQRLLAQEPEHVGYQRDLSVSYNKMGDLFRTLGQGNDARTAYAASLEIRERLAAREPERADFQRDLASSHDRMGDLFRDSGEGDSARKAYAASLKICERLATREPERVDYQLDLSTAYNKTGDLFRAVGQRDDARKAYVASLAIRERLAAREPERADYQRALSVCYTRLASLAQLDRCFEDARRWFERDLAIAEKLAAAEPTRADYQVDVAISLTTTAMYAGSAARARLERAAEILRTLDAEGRLAPAERSRMEVVARLLAALP